MFRAENLLTGYGHYETQGRSVGHFIFDEATGITNFVVKGTFTSDFGHRVGAGRFGDPDNGWKLPPDVSFTIGESAETRGNFFVGWSNYGSDGAYLEATSGGVFSGWLDEFRVGRNSWASVKLAAMDSIELDTGVFAVAEGGNNVAELTLPPGNVRCDSFLLASGCRGNLALYGTTVQIDVSATIGPDREGTVNTYIGANDGLCGLRFGEDVVPAFGAQGVINLHFAAPAVKPCAGVCFEGSREEEVQALIDGGKIVIDGIDGADVSKVRVFTFRGDTYVGIQSRGTIVLLQ